MSFHPHRLIETLHRHAPATSCWVAYSGGVDSHVLLHALARQRAELPWPLGAVHIHHGLQAQADAWSEHCRQVCAALDIPFVLLQGDARPAAGESPEASARDLRYALLRDWLPDDALLLSAHHQDDQAETLLLQLLRGAGPKGLSAMPASAPLGSGALLRPLLNYGRADLLTYAEAEGLKWIEDPSNADTRYDRNFLRHRLLPELKSRWPATAMVLSRSAELCAEAAALEEATAEQDLATAQGSGAGTLSVTALADLTAARQRNLLRHWLQLRAFSLPSRALLQRILDEVLHCRADAEPRVHWAGAEVRRYRDDLFVMDPLPAQETGVWELVAGGRLSLAGGELALEADTGAGLRLAEHEACTVRFRRGGERIRLPGRTHHHAVKQFLQEQGVPPWERERLPLLYVGDELVALAGLCIAAGRTAGPGERGWRVRWSRWPQEA